jgi:hypothetical protein
MTRLNLETEHGKHCFVVMPFGRTQDEHRWFSGWYEVVIKPAIETAGFECILAAAEEQPGAINDEIRTHLAFDPMVVVDLAGASPSDAPNPNVMYELGLRHAFGLPLVIMAWEHQTLPFDVNNQRAIMSQRGFKDIEPTKAKLVQFIKAAQAGNYYRPMDVVGRNAALSAASNSLAPGSELAMLIEEVRDLRNNIEAVRYERQYSSQRVKQPTVKAAMGNRKSDLWRVATEIGYDPASWAKILGTKLDETRFTLAKNWSNEEWKYYLESTRPATWTLAKPVLTTTSNIDPALLEMVDEMMGPQPWPSGTARDVAEKLEIGTSTVARVIDFLIAAGRRKEQADGIVFENREDYLRYLEDSDKKPA